MRNPVYYSAVNWLRQCWQTVNIELMDIYILTVLFFDFWAPFLGLRLRARAKAVAVNK